MLATDLPTLPPSKHPVGCKLLLRSLPDTVTARYGIIPGYDGPQFVLHDSASHQHAICGLVDLDFPTLRAMLDAIGHADHKVWGMKMKATGPAVDLALSEPAGHA